MSIVIVILLAVVQGLAELLPVSSSAHVVVAAKLLGLDPTSPSMTLLLVMLHTGTMLAVIAYFWRSWRDTYFKSVAAFKGFAVNVILATLATGIIGGGLTLLIQKVIRAENPDAQIEDLFGHLELIAAALAAAGILIIIAGVIAKQHKQDSPEVSLAQSVIVGAVQGLCLPFRGFSRSGATISTGMLLRISRRSIEAFSFALAVVLTPPVIVREAWRLMKAPATATGNQAAVGFSLLGALVAFIAGLAALRWLSRWLETDRWYLFGIYCLVAAAAVAYLHGIGY